MSGPVSMTPDQAREVMARVTRHASYDDGSLTQTEKDLFAACNTLISQAQALVLLNGQLDTLERECVGLHNSVRAMDDELAQVKADLRYLCGVKS